MPTAVACHGVSRHFKVISGGILISSAPPSLKYLPRQFSRHGRWRLRLHIVVTSHRMHGSSVTAVEYTLSPSHRQSPVNTRILIRISYRYVHASAALVAENSSHLHRSNLVIFREYHGFNIFVRSQCLVRNFHRVAGLFGSRQYHVIRFSIIRISPSLLCSVDTDSC